MHSAKRNFFFIAFLAVLLPTAAIHAQATGSIRGTVVDTSGALISGATVTATNSATSTVRSASTNEDGIYVFPALPIGAYSLQVSRDGFETQKRDGIQLLTGQTLDLRIEIAVGSVTQSVEVTSAAPLIQTASSSVQTSVDQKQIQELPLNGRNPLQLTVLTPGTTLTSVGTESGQQDNTGLSVNGLRATQNNFQLDGAIYTNRFFDSVPILPNPDALQEFTIQSSNYSAEYGGAGALVQLSTRSGTNDIHGSAYEFLRNTVLDARNYFQQTAPPFKLNQFGGTVGGPIIKNRTFFFFGAEDLQQRSSPNPISITVPTAAELNGDFSALLGKGIAIFNPATGQPYPNNIIPTPINTLSGKLAQKYLVPLASDPVTGVFNSTSNSNIDSTQYLAKIDQVITQNNHLSGRYFYNQDNFQRPFNAPLGFYAANYFRNQSVIVTDTQVFSPTLTGTFSASAGRFARTQIPQAPGLQSLQDLGQNVPLGSPGETIFPGIRANISGFVNIFSGGALTQAATSFDYKGGLIKVLHAHTLDVGAEYERDRVNMNDYSYTPGDNTFNGQRTAAPTGAALPAGTKTSGSALADFYLGLDSQFFQDNGRKAYLRTNRPSIYVQDDWKVLRNLTVNLGLRWDPWLPPIDLNETLVGFIPGFQSQVASNAPQGLVFKGDQGLQESVFQKNWKDFAPRVGFAYNVDGAGKTVIRAGYGIFYGFPEGLLYQRTDAMQPVDLYLTYPAPSATWDNIYAGYPGGSPFPRGHVSPSDFANYQFQLPVSGGVLDPKSKVAYTQNWNLTFEQQLPDNVAFSLAYVGNHGEHIIGSRQFNPAIYGPGATVGNENSRRLYPGLAAVEIAQSYEYAIYNSLQANLVKRSHNGLTLLTNIVWSKAIDNSSSATEGNTGPPNPFNLQSGRGPADFDQAIRYNLSINYVTPHVDVTGFKSALLNHWQLNGIASLQTGSPFTVVSGTDRSLSGIGNDYADIVGNPLRPAGVNKIKEYFNTAAFVPAATGTFGTTSRNSLRGPGYADVDTSIFKDFLQGERVHAQFRAEAFNTFNRVNFSNPVASVSSGTYGQITSAGSPRVFQFGLKFLF
ncbi:MAG TPA: carboxypeptidase regulatory-like domain-containing protein [Alloacidobacterium sp.]|nr:carboxypeptidase regulatory-like domain-containing protein [Alloacidobacterium sp.]